MPSPKLENMLEEATKFSEKDREHHLPCVWQPFISKSPSIRIPIRKRAYQWNQVGFCNLFYLQLFNVSNQVPCII